MVPALLLPASPADAAWPEAALAGTAPVEKPLVDLAPAAVPADEAPPAEKAPVEEAPAEAPLADEAPADEALAQAAPVETPSSDGAPAEATPVEELSADVAPTERGPVEEPSIETAQASEAIPADRTPVGEPSADVAPAEAAPVETSPVGEAPAEAFPVEAPPIEKAPVEAPSAEAAPVDAPPVGVAPVEADPVRVRPVGVPRGWARPDAAPARAIPPGRAQRGTARRAEPGWGTVLATTVRLWTRRRLAHPRWRAAFVLLLAVIVIGAVIIPIVLSQGRPSGQPGSRGNSQASSAGTLGAAAVRRQAAVWIARQISGDAVVACDPAMCGALQTAGVPAGRLLILRPGQSDPLGSDILVATVAVRSQFGNRLAGVYAPVVVAAFGTGTTRIDVRVEAPDGAADYLAALAADVAARKAAGAQIVHNAAIEASPTARRQLVAGQVDSRLLETLVTLSHAYRIDIISFGAGPASGATPGVPLRYAEITGATRGGHRPASLHTLRAFLSAQRTPYRPLRVTTGRIGSRSVLRVEYPAPSPLGLLGSHG